MPRSMTISVRRPGRCFQVLEDEAHQDDDACNLSGVADTVANDGVWRKASTAADSNTRPRTRERLFGCNLQRVP